MQEKKDPSFEKWAPVLSFITYPEIPFLRMTCLFFNKNGYLLFRFLSEQKKSKAEKELMLVFKNQALRIYSLTRQFLQKSDESCFINIENTAFSELSTLSPNLAGLILDDMRTHSSILYQQYNCAFFQDYHHREAIDQAGFFSLSQLSCRLKDTDEKSVFIPIFSQLAFLVVLYFIGFGKTDESHHTLHLSTLPFTYFNTSQTMFLLKIPAKLFETILHELGYLGALPNRDWQLQHYISRTNLEETYAWYVAAKPILSNFPIVIVFSGTKVLIESPNLKIKSISSLLQQHLRKLDPSFQAEQRAFYIQLLLNLMGDNLFISDQLKEQESKQCLLSLARIENLVSNLDTFYTNFLRTIETIMEEILLLMTINSQNKYSAQHIMDSVKQFVVNTVGITPQQATLRTSAMQAIWLSFQSVLLFYHQRNANLSLLVSECAYYEIFNVLNVLFRLNLKHHRQALSLSVEPLLCKSVSLPMQPDTIYDVFMGNFESNILVHHNKIQYTDIQALVLKQFNLRKKYHKSDRPFILILDNTMSHFKDSSLPALLNTFENEIQNGSLCILVSHSGNKYFHAGTDKGLAALFYAFYNPDKFPAIRDCFLADIANNKMGDFSPDSPTILLTKAFMDYCWKDILAYDSLIRQRTAWLFNTVISNNLLDEQQFFSIDYPFSSHSPEKYGGFITIKTHFKFFSGDLIHKKIVEVVPAFLNQIGFFTRDGYGFSETTRVRINSPGESVCFRISIGTESLDILGQKFHALCDYLATINAVMNEFRIDHNQDFGIQVSAIIWLRLLEAIRQFNCFNQICDRTPLMQYSLFANQSYNVENIPERLNTQTNAYSQF